MFSMFSMYPSGGFLCFLCFLYIAWGDDHGCKVHATNHYTVGVLKHIVTIWMFEDRGSNLLSQVWPLLSFIPLALVYVAHQPALLPSLPSPGSLIHVVPELIPAKGIFLASPCPIA